MCFDSYSIYICEIFPRKRIPVPLCIESQKQEVIFFGRLGSLPRVRSLLATKICDTVALLQKMVNYLAHLLRCDINLILGLGMG